MKKITLIKSILLITSTILLCGCGTDAVENDETTEETVANEDSVSFNYASGFYEENISLELSYKNPDAVIYYTLDGSAPDNTSTVYEGPINLTNATPNKNLISDRTDIQAGCTFTPVGEVTKANVIRAVAYNTDGTVSDISSGTFFVGVDRDSHYSDVPVISLMTDSDNLYDYETGIYVLGKTYDDWCKEDSGNKDLSDWQSVGNYSNKGKDWEKEVYFEYLALDSSENYGTNLGLKIKGATTRGYYQKSLKLTARKEYGTSKVDYELIPGTTSFKSFVLRMGGNDANFAKYRDPLLQSLVKDMDFETQDSTPCVVFINGEYFGIYEITEDYTDKRFEYRYGVNSDDVVIIKCGELDEGEESDFALYQEMFDFITTNDMSNDDMYEEAAGLLDLQSFVDYLAFELYIYNQDSIFGNNNWAMWRTRNDGIWKMMVYDTEYSTGIYNEGKTATTDNFSNIFTDEVEEDSPVLLFRALYENDSFKAMFYDSLCDVRNIYFEKSRAVAASNEMATVYKKLIAESIYRNGPDWVAYYQDPNDYYKSKVGELNLFLSGRYTQYLDVVRKAAGLEKLSSLTLNTNDYELGALAINTHAVDLSELNKNTYSGTYFKEFPITLTATANEGHSFDHWDIEGINTESVDLSNPVLTITLTEDCQITAVFK